MWSSPVRPGSWGDLGVGFPILTTPSKGTCDPVTATAGDPRSDYYHSLPPQAVESLPRPG